MSRVARRAKRMRASAAAHVTIMEFVIGIPNGRAMSRALGESPWASWPPSANAGAAQSTSPAARLDHLATRPAVFRLALVSILASSHQARSVCHLVEVAEG